MDNPSWSTKLIAPTVGIIMAGGAGERFWPLSRKKRPKQLLKLTHEKLTLLEEAIERILPIISPEQLFVSTNQALQEPIRAALTCIPPENILAEPARRNTTGCLAYVTSHLLARFGRDNEDMVMAITTADHKIGDDDAFRNSVKAAIWYAKEHNAIVVVGIQPTRPETGYGYIEVPAGAQSVAAFCGASIIPTTFFREKPSLSTAEEYLSKGNFFWNSGMFFWRMSTFLRSLEIHAPEVRKCIHEMRDALITGFNPDTIVASIFERLPNLSIDYSLMEKVDRVFMVRGEFPWDDVGLWDSLSRFHSKDECGNVSIGDPILIDCKDVTVYNEPGADSMAVGVIGMDNVIVATTQDGILICPKDRANEVRSIVDKLKERSASQI